MCNVLSVTLNTSNWQCIPLWNVYFRIIRIQCYLLLQLHQLPFMFAQVFFTAYCSTQIGKQLFGPGYFERNSLLPKRNKFDANKKIIQLNLQQRGRFTICFPSPKETTQICFKTLPRYALSVNGDIFTDTFGRLLFNGLIKFQ